jgi:leucyl-tRNA synthetase
MIRWPEIPRTSAEAFVLMLAPMAPHVAEELWWKLGHAASLAHERWPEWQDHLLAAAQVEIPVQVMGRVRSHVTVAADADAPALERAALDDAKVQAHIAGKTIRRVIVVPGKLVNIVTG